MSVISSDEINKAYLNSFAIEWRHLASSQATTECEIFGRKLKTPVMCAGLAHYEKMHEGGMVAFAEGAKAAGTSMWTGMSSNEEIESVIAVGAPGGRIIKPLADHDKVLSYIAHDEKIGAAAFAMDIDHVYRKDGSLFDFFGDPLESPTRAVLEEYQKSTSLPFFPKGVLSVRDAVICAEAGCKGIIVSAHQNMFPESVPQLKAVQAIRKELGDKLTILVDGNLETGYDVFKALAMGADGVFVGRPLIPEFTQKGSEGVTAYIRRLTDELRCCLCRTASPDIYHIDPSCIVRL